MVFLLLFLLLPAVTFPPSFDVSATLQQAEEEVAAAAFPDYESLLLDSGTSSSSSAISLLLVPREAVYKPTFPDYKSLLAARVRRDAARLNYFRAKINGVAAPVKSGIPDSNDPAYFARLALGTPPQSFWLNVDTGSDVNWVPCQPCNGCASSQPIFDPFQSSSYSNLPCSSSECVGLDESGCRSEVCLYQIRYKDRSYSFGEYATDMMSVGDNFTARIAIGCGHDNPEDDPKRDWLGGLIGLGPGEASLPNQLKATSFSYCLVKRNSCRFSTLEFNVTLPPDSVITNLKIKEQGAYFIGVNGLSVDGQKLPVRLSGKEDGGVMVDSGTTVTFMPRKVYDSVREAIVRSLPQLVPLEKMSRLPYDLCYRFDSRQQRRRSFNKFPSVAFHFTNGQNWTLPPRNVVEGYGGDLLCVAFLPNDDPFAVIGNIQMQGTRITYDLANNLIGFSNGKC